MSTGLRNSDVPIFDSNFKKYKHIDRFVTRFDERVSKLKLNEQAYAKGLRCEAAEHLCANDGKRTALLPQERC